MQESCKECGKYKACSEMMPYTHINGVWQTTAEKRRWMRTNCADCFVSSKMWEDIKGKFREDNIDWDQ